MHGQESSWIIEYHGMDSEPRESHPKCLFGAWATSIRRELPDSGVWYYLWNLPKPVHSRISGKILPENFETPYFSSMLQSTEFEIDGKIVEKNAVNYF